MRRLFTLPAYLALAILALLLAPLWVPAAAIFDAIRGRAALRCGAFLTLYLQAEVAGVLLSFGAWLFSFRRARFLRWNFRLECWWASVLLRGATLIYGLRFEIENAEAASRPPLVLMLRHSGVGDTLLAAVLVSRPNDLHLRYVLKRELLWDPCLEIVGRRLPNYFVHRGSEDSAREIEGVAALFHGLGKLDGIEREGILIYPEGTRFTPSKRERILAKLRESSPEFHERAAGLRHVLPPRLGGPLALLDRNPGADVVFCAHTGFEPAGSFWDLWNGKLIGSTVRVNFWRIPYGDIPKDHDARIDWLYDHWQRVDAWIADNRK